jgi:hypothetical protein
MQITLSDSRQMAHQGESRVLGVALCTTVWLLYLSCSKCTSPDAPIPSERAAADPVIVAHVKRNRVTTDCRALDEKAELYSARAGHCKTDQDCCLIWDLAFFGCTAANKAEDLAALRDNIRAQTRNCGSGLPPLGSFPSLFPELDERLQVRIGTADIETASLHHVTV